MIVGLGIAIRGQGGAEELWIARLVAGAGHVGPGGEQRV